jgi:hypothetical protein
MKIYNGIHETGRLDPDTLTYKENYDVCNILLDFFNKNNIFQSGDFKYLNMGNAEAIYQNKEDIIVEYKSTEFQYRFPFPISSKVQETFKLFVDDEYIPRTQYQLYSHMIEFNDGVTFREGAPIKTKFEGYCKIYSIGNAINYHITKEDERAYYTAKKLIEIDIPAGFGTDYIKCCSYNGILNEHYDYELNEDKTKIIFNIEPQRDKVIQIFMNRK